jgi:hypothetical protein
MFTSLSFFLKKSQPKNLSLKLSVKKQPPQKNTPCMRFLMRLLWSSTMTQFNRKDDHLNNRLQPFFGQEPNESEQPAPQPEKHPMTALEEKQEMLSHHVRMVAKRMTNGLFIFGNRAGLGKSETVKQTLASEGIVPVTINSHATPLGMYQTLYQHRKDEVLFCDDADSMYTDMKVLGILRSALWGSPRTVTYTSSALPDDLPPSFDFDSTIIMAANIIPKKNPAFKAVLSRIDCFELRASNAEVVEFMRSIAERGIPGVIKEEAMAVIDFIQEEGGSRQLSLRLLELSCKKVIYARETGLDWKSLVRSQLYALGEQTVEIDDLECLKRAVEQFPNSPRQQQALWSKMTKKSRATFYRKLEKFDQQQISSQS